MRADNLVQTQLLMAQAVAGCAKTLQSSVGYSLTPVAFAGLPAGRTGAIACVNNSNTAVWGAVIAGGGANVVLAFYNGTNWTVAGK